MLNETGSAYEGKEKEKKKDKKNKKSRSDTELINPGTKLILAPFLHM